MSLENKFLLKNHVFFLLQQVSLENNNFWTKSPYVTYFLVQNESRCLFRWLTLDVAVVWDTHFSAYKNEQSLHVQIHSRGKKKAVLQPVLPTVQASNPVDLTMDHKHVGKKLSMIWQIISCVLVSIISNTSSKFS